MYSPNFEHAINWNKKYSWLELMIRVISSDFIEKLLNIGGNTAAFTFHYFFQIGLICVIYIVITLSILLIERKEVWN